MFNSNSKENQDLFVLSVLDKKINGTYKEFIGEKIELHSPNEKYINLFNNFLN